MMLFCCDDVAAVHFFFGVLIAFVLSNVGKNSMDKEHIQIYWHMRFTRSLHLFLRTFTEPFTHRIHPFVILTIK